MGSKRVQWVQQRTKPHPLKLTRNSLTSLAACFQSAYNNARNKMISACRGFPSRQVVELVSIHFPSQIYLHLSIDLSIMSFEPIPGYQQAQKPRSSIARYAG